MVLFPITILFLLKWNSPWGHMPMSRNRRDLWKLTCHYVYCKDVVYHSAVLFLKTTHRRNFNFIKRIECAFSLHQGYTCFINTVNFLKHLSLDSGWAHRFKGMQYMYSSSMFHFVFLSSFAFHLSFHTFIYFPLL